MRLRQRILVGYGVTLALLAVVVIWSIVNLVNLGQASDAILRENYKSILAAENMIDAIERQDSATLLLTLNYDDEGVAQFRENESQFLQWLSRAKDNITIAGEADIVASIESAYATYLVQFSKLRQLKTLSPQGIGAFYHETVLPTFRQIRDDAIRLRDMNDKTMFAASRRTQAVADTATWSTVLVAAIAIGLGLAFGLLLSSRLSQPIQRMMRAVDALAEGNYDTRVPASGPDEMARLAEGFNAMAVKLGDYHRLNVERVVAEKRKSEAVLRSIEDGIVVVDADFRIDDINPQAGRILGINPEASVGKHFLEIINNEQLFNWIKETAASKKPPRVEEGKNVLTVGDGDLARHYMYGITPVVSKGGGMMGVVLLLRDITQLKEIDRMKSEFVMTASHELKTPLQSIGMSIELLKEGAAGLLDDKQVQLLDAASEETARLKSLVRDLLDLSKIEAGKVEMEFDRVSPRALAEMAVEVFHIQADEKGIRLDIDIADDVPDVRADANKITWVLSNLIANALRYADSRIRVSARLVGQWVHIAVADDGEGIPSEYQSRIFAKFVQVKSAKSVGGTGLGLAICKEIVRAHSGTIWVDSTPGDGSTFTFTLPVAQ